MYLEELQVGAEYPSESVTALTPPRNPYNGIAEVTVTAVNGEGKTVLSSVTEAVILRKRED